MDSSKIREMARAIYNAIAADQTSALPLPEEHKEKWIATTVQFVRVLYGALQNGRAATLKELAIDLAHCYFQTSNDHDALTRLDPLDFPTPNSQFSWDALSTDTRLRWMSATAAALRIHGGFPELVGLAESQRLPEFNAGHGQAKFEAEHPGQSWLSLPILARLAWELLAASETIERWNGQSKSAGVVYFEHQHPGANWSDLTPAEQLDWENCGLTWLVKEQQEAGQTLIAARAELNSVIGFVLATAGMPERVEPKEVSDWVPDVTLVPRE